MSMQDEEIVAEFADVAAIHNDGTEVADDSEAHDDEADADDDADEDEED